MTITFEAGYGTGRSPAAPLTLKQVDPRMRQLTLYRDLIDRTTGDAS